MPTSGEAHSNPQRELELEPWIRLASIPRLSSTSQRKLLAAFGTPTAALAARPDEVSAQLDKGALDAWRAGPDAQLVQRIVDWLRWPDNALITLADEAYPQALLNTPDPPPVLYAKGRVELLAQRALAVVGARSATPAGMRDAESFAETLGLAGLTIVSGLATGIDAAAHRGGLRTAASSVAVVATGLDKVYPSRNRDL